MWFTLRLAPVKCLAYVCVYCEGEAQGELLEVRDEVKIVLSKEGFICIYIYMYS